VTYSGRARPLKASPSRLNLYGNASEMGGLRSPPLARNRLMSQFFYMMQFKGKVSPLGTSPNVMKARMAAASCVCLTVVGPQGVQTTLEPAASGQAIFESEVTFIGGFESSEVTSAGEGGFKETGMITFGEGEHRLRFSTVGQGYIGPSVEPN